MTVENCSLILNLVISLKKNQENIPWVCTETVNVSEQLAALWPLCRSPSARPPGRRSWPRRHQSGRRSARRGTPLLGGPPLIAVLLLVLRLLLLFIEGALAILKRFKFYGLEIRFSIAILLIWPRAVSFTLSGLLLLLFLLLLFLLLSL